MPEPLENRAATGAPQNGGGAAELAELRRIIIGQELEHVADLQKRLDDPAVRAAETGKVLAGAIKAAPGRGLREALEPVFERSFQNSVRKHPREISDAIYPVMGPAIRTSIAAAIREFAESLNQIVEKSASWRAIRWRVEARVTGRPFAEILLARSLLYSVEQVFLIHRNSGLLLMHVSAQSAVVKDADMVSGMFTAIQDFVSDSFTGGNQELETIDVGQYKLWIQYGPKAMIVGAVSGTAPVELKGVFRSALDKIHETLFAPLDAFKQDDLSVFEPARPYLESCLLGQKAPERRSHIVLWLALAAAGVVLAFIFWQVRSQKRWDGFVAALGQQPGIAVIRAEKHGSSGLITGLKDPKATDPAQLLAGFGLDAAKVRFDWQPYLSLDTPFAAERELESDVNRIQAQIVRFEVGSAKLPLGEAGRIDELVVAIERILNARPDARIGVTGHTDEVGSPADNTKLSLDRAVMVRQAFIAQGIRPDAIDIAGAGNSQPVRNGGTDWDRAANRSVSFRVTLASALR